MARRIIIEGAGSPSIFNYDDIAGITFNLKGNSVLFISWESVDSFTIQRVGEDRSVHVVPPPENNDGTKQ